MLFQQLKSMHSLHLEDVGESVDNPSTTVANYNRQQQHSPILYQKSFDSSILVDENSDQRHPFLYQKSLDSSILIAKSLNRFRTFCSGKISQSTRSRFGESSSTSLDKLWYTYSYIYRIIILILLAILFMPTTDSTTFPIGIVSPSPQIPRTRSFTMSNFTSIVEFS